MTATIEGTHPHARRYLRYVLAFGVSMAVGLSPLLGKVNVPGFTAILSLFPLGLRDTVVPFAAFIMALPALAVQFYALERVEDAWVRRWFAMSLSIAAVSAVVLFALLMQFTVDVQPPAAGQPLRYVIGNEMRSVCPCKVQDLEIQECIGKLIATDPAQVESCYPRSEVQLHKTITSLVYFVMMAAFGTAIGMLILREGARRARRRT